MGSAFPAEPREWIAGRRDAILFAHSDPELVAHYAAPACLEEAPHAAADCGLLAVEPRATLKR